MRYSIVLVFGMCVLLLYWLYWPLERDTAQSTIDQNGVSLSQLPGTAMTTMAPVVHPFPSPEETEDKPDANTHNLHGRLSSKDRQLELAGIRLQLTSAAGHTMHSPEITTDPEGRFVFDDLPFASYIVLLKEPGLAFAEGVNPLVHLNSQTAADEIVLEVTQGGVITGRVYNVATNASISGMYVAAIPIATNLQATLYPTPTPQLSVATETDGMYRIDHLSPGMYRLFHVDMKYAQESLYRLAMQQAQHYYMAHMHLGMPVLPGQERSRLAPVEAEVRVGEITSEIDLPLHIPALSHIAGYVVDQDGYSVPDVTLRISQATLDLSITPINRSVQSDAEGRFRFDEVPAGDSYTITTDLVITAADSMDTNLSSRQQKSMRIDTLTVEGRDDVEIILTRYGVIRGRVLDMDGAPYPLVVGLVNLEPEFNREITRCDPEGRFTMTFVHTGQYRIDAIIGGENFQELATLDIAPGELVDDLILYFDSTGTQTIKGIVLDESGAPINRVHVSAERRENDMVMSRAQEYSDDTGQFNLLLNDAAGSYQVRFSHGAYLDKALSNISAGTENLRVVLNAGFTLRGKVVDARNNQPIELYGLSVRSIGDASSTPIEMTPEEYRVLFADSSPDNTITSPIGYHQGGVFELQGMGSSVWLSVWANDYLKHNQLIEGLTPTSARQEVIIRLRAAPLCEGKVVDSNGRPVPFAQVQIGQESYFNPLTGQVRGLQRSVTTNELGHFSVQRLASGADYALVATHPEFLPGIVTLPDSDRDVRGLEIELLRGARIEGRITHSSRPASGVEVVFDKNTLGHIGTLFGTITAQNGRYLLENLPEGEGLLHLAWEEAGVREVIHLEVALMAEHTTTIDYDLSVE